MITRKCLSCGRMVALVIMTDGRNVEIDLRTTSYGSISLDPDGVHAHVMTLEEYGNPSNGRQYQDNRNRYEYHALHCGE